MWTTVNSLQLTNNQVLKGDFVHLNSIFPFLFAEETGVSEWTEEPKFCHAMNFTPSFMSTCSAHSQHHHFPAGALPSTHGVAALSPAAAMAPLFQLQLSTEHPFAFPLYCHIDFYGTCRNLITLKIPDLSWTQGKLIMGSKVIENEGQNRWTDRWDDCLCCCLRKQANNAGVSW